jgi:hypothetical protein
MDPHIVGGDFRQVCNLILFLLKKGLQPVSTVLDHRVINLIEAPEP